MERLLCRHHPPTVPRDAQPSAAPPRLGPPRGDRTYPTRLPYFSAGSHRGHRGSTPASVRYRPCDGHRRRRGDAPRGNAACAGTGCGDGRGTRGTGLGAFGPVEQGRTSRSPVSSPRWSGFLTLRFAPWALAANGACDVRCCTPPQVITPAGCPCSSFRGGVSCGVSVRHCWPLALHPSPRCWCSRCRAVAHLVPPTPPLHFPGCGCRARHPPPYQPRSPR